MPKAADGFIPRLLQIQWNITERCNLHCTHCYQEAETSTSKELSQEQANIALESIYQLATNWNIKIHLTISGGEPLQCTWFWPLVETIATKRSRLSFSVLSNGTLLTADYCKRLKQLGCTFVQISLDGAATTHDQIRGIGAHAKACTALRELRRAGIQTMVSFTVSAKNQHDFPAVAKLCRKLGVSTLWSDRLIPMGAGQCAEMLQPAQVRTFFASMADAAPRGLGAFFNRTTIRMHRALQFITLRERGIATQAYSCNAGRTLLSILHDGSIVPCRRMPIVVGNILTDEIASVYQTAQILQELRREDNIPQECHACSHRQECRGGLRCLSHAFFGNPFKADPQCFMLYTDLPSQETSPHGKPQCCD